MDSELYQKIDGLRSGAGREIIFVIFALTLPAVTILALVYPPTIISQGVAHRMFYIHVPIAWVALYAPVFSAICGLAYLITRREKFDVWSLANARLAALFGVAVVISGPLWAATEWGTYWKWSDQRLMTFFILLLCLGGYFLTRFMTDGPRQKAVYSAYMSIIAAAASVLTWFAIRVVTPDIHPESVMGTMSPKIRLTFWLSVLGYHLVFWTMLRLVTRQEYIRRAYLAASARKGAHEN